MEALRLAVELRPDAVVVGTATGDMPSTSLLRRLAADDRLVGVRRIALAGEREEDPSPGGADRRRRAARPARRRPPRSSAAACGVPRSVTPPEASSTSAGTNSSQPASSVPSLIAISSW